MKNHVIDEVVKLLVNLSFTEKEKEDRSNEIKQRSARSSQFHAISKSPQGGQVRKLNPDSSVPGRTTCAKMTQSLLSEMFTQFQFRCYGDENICDFLLDLHVEMYKIDCESLALVYNRI